MSNKLDDLLLRWEELRRIGRPASVDELCRASPELREELRAKVNALEKMDQVLNLKTTSSSGRQRTRYDDLRPGQEPVSGYKLEKRLGRGGFGEVWKAIGPGGFAVALKFVSLNGNLGANELRSLEIIKTVHHPSLLATFGSWQTNGFLVIAMELADRTLMDRLNEAVAEGLPGIPRDELIRYMLEAAKGIDYLNQPGDKKGDSTKAAIQHRDIKPQNILLMGGGIKIGDFGLLRILKTTVTEGNNSMTLAYTAPESLNGHAARSSDQYSLAVTYCHLRGGRLPFVGPVGQVIEGHMKNRPDLSMIPASERKQVARALNKHHQERWRSCLEFVDALCEEPLSQDRPRAWRFGKWAIAFPGRMFSEVRRTVSDMLGVLWQFISRAKRVERSRPYSRVRVVIGYTLLICAMCLAGFMAFRMPEPHVSNSLQRPRQYMDLDLGGGVKMKMVRIEPGKFMMG